AEHDGLPGDAFQRHGHGEHTEDAPEIGPAPRWASYCGHRPITDATAQKLDGERRANDDADDARHDECRTPRGEGDQYARHDAIESEARTAKQSVDPHRVALLAGRADHPADTDRMVECTEGADAAERDREQEGVSGRHKATADRREAKAD